MEKMKILVVDDSLTMRRIIINALCSIGYEKITIRQFNARYWGQENNPDPFLFIQKPPLSGGPV
jgi:hypothetical protein